MHARTGDPYTLVFEMEDETRNGNFHITPDDEGMAVDGPGSVTSLLIVCADSDDFGLRLESGQSALVNDDYEKLRQWSDELPNISAYAEPDGDRILAVSGYHFLDFVRAEITVTSESTFEWIRAVYTVTRGVDR